MVKFDVQPRDSDSRGTQDETQWLEVTFHANGKINGRLNAPIRDVGVCDFTATQRVRTGNQENAQTLQQLQLQEEYRELNQSWYDAYREAEESRWQEAGMRASDESSASDTDPEVDAYEEDSDGAGEEGYYPEFY